MKEKAHSYCLSYLNALLLGILNQKYVQLGFFRQTRHYVLAKYPQWHSVLLFYLHIQVIDSQLAIEVLCNITAKPHSLQIEGRVTSRPHSSEFYTARVAPCRSPKENPNLSILNRRCSQFFQDINRLVVIESLPPSCHVAQVLHGVQLAVWVLRSRIIH